MEFLFYSIVCSATYLIFVLIWKRCSFFSAEGLCTFFHFTYLSTDHFHLAVQAINSYFLDENTAEFDYELEVRFASNLIFLLGFLFFYLGVRLIDHSLKRRSSDTFIYNHKEIRKNSLLFCIGGLVMYFLAWLAVGVSSLADVWDNLMNFATSTGSYGFLNEGLTLFMIGTAILAVTNLNKLKKNFLVILLFIIPILFSPSRSGVQLPILILAIVSWHFNRNFFWSMFKLRVFITLLLVYSLSVAVKAPLKYGTETGDTSIASMTELSISSLGGRYGQHGIFYAFTVLVDNLRLYPHLSGNGAALHYGFITVIPRVLWPDKPLQPTIGLGWLTEDSKSPIHDLARDQSESVTLTLPGMWFWDFLYLGVTLGMFASGMVIRGITLTMQKPVNVNSYPCSFIWWCSIGQLLAGYSSFGYIIVYLFILISLEKTFSFFTRSIKD